MIRATVGIWVNYATTGVFQVVFAVRYGSGHSASAFVITFGIAIAASGVLASAAQGLVVPRLLGPSGEILRQPLRLMAWICVSALLLLGLLAILAGPLAGVLGPAVHLPRGLLEEPLRFSAVFAFLQVLAGALVAALVARGARFVPAVAPAFPSIAAALLLVLSARPSLDALYLALVAGSVLEVVILPFGFRGSIRFAAGEVTRIRSIAFGTILIAVLLNVTAPLERIFASVGSADGAAQYNYAIRSLAVVQQLLIGGLLMAALGDWSALMRTAQEKVMRGFLVRTAVAATLLLTLASSVAVVAVRPLVALVYQHGAFGGSDTRAVSTLLLLCLPGFCAEGIGLILSQALLAARRNAVTIGVGAIHFAVRVGLVVVFGELWGARGVAIAYSVAMTAVLLIQAGAVTALAFAGRSELRIIVNGLVVAAGTVATAGACATAGSSLPLALKAGAVFLSFGALVLAFRPVSARVFAHA